MGGLQLASDRSTGLSAETRRYGLRQLARRAGVSHEWFRGWRIEHKPDQTVVFPCADGRQCITFNHGSEEFWQRLTGGKFTVGRASWPSGSREQRPDLIVPFADPDLSGPLFTVDGGAAQCSADLLASTVLTLSRYEETVPGPRDRHGRFPADASLAAKHDFAMRPIVDEFGLALEDALQRLFPTWKPEPRSLQVHLTHDVDEIGIPFTLRKVAKSCVRGGMSRAVRDVLSGFGGRPTSLAAVLDTVRLNRSRNLHGSVYWKSSPSRDFDSGYEIRDRRVDEVMQTLSDSGIEHGVHPSYDTYLDRECLAEEIGRLRRVIGGGAPLGGRQHFLRWSPQTWSDWEACGLGYDSSVGFSECVGFRAGTCHPYRPWLFDQDREAELLEVPLIAMDCALTGPMGLRGEQCVEPLLKCIEACKFAGGVFTLLWHTDSILEPVYGDSYQRVLDALTGVPELDSQACLAEGYA